MMDSIDQLAQGWSRWMVAASWQLALLVIAVAILVRALRKASPRLRHALWLLVLAKIFLPPSLTLPTGIGSWGLNSRSHNNFQSEAGIQLKPVVFEFQTK